MISAPDRREAVQLIKEAVAAGARRALACAELGLSLSLRTLQRWQHRPEDRRAAVCWRSPTSCGAGTSPGYQAPSGDATSTGT